MAQEDPPRRGLFSKVVRFVSHPATPWSQLDQPDPSAEPRSREQIKDMLARRKRNDFVRVREFDLLRRLRNKEIVSGIDSNGRPTFFQTSLPSTHTDERAQTLRKIDEIEEQMSTQWWKKGAGASTPPGSAHAANRAALRSRPAPPPGAAVPVVTTVAAPVPEVDVFSRPDLSAVEVSEVVHDPELEEAAIRFANGDDRAAEASLLEAVGPGGPRHEHAETWLALFDFYRATARQAPFEAAAMDFARLFGRSAPHWVSLPELAERGAAATAAQAPAQSRVCDWTAPPTLDAAAVRRLTASVPDSGAARLDWSALEAIEPGAAPALVQLFTRWCASPVQFEFIAPERLSGLLRAATPSGRGDLDPVWWQLRMEACRLMHDASGFELAALDYCVTYEVSPPSWEDVASGHAAIHAAGPAAPGAAPLGAGHAPLRAEPLVLDAPDGRGQAPRLVGQMAGDAAPALQKLDAAWDGAKVLTIDCSLLLRVGFGAAGALLNWASAHHAEGRQLHFVEVHRLLAPLFGVIGIHEHGTVALRRD